MTKTSPLSAPWQNPPEDLPDYMMRFCYEGIVADCPKDQFDFAVAEISAMPKAERVRYMASVKKCLDRFMKLGEKMTTQDRQNCCADISLFFANEAVEGRLDNYKSAVQ